MAEIKVERRRGAGMWSVALLGLAVVGLVAMIIGLMHKRDSERAATVGAAAGCAKDEDCPGRQLCADGSCRDIGAGAAECRAGQVHFATDSAEIPDSDRAALGRMARCLKASQSMRLTIAGTTDERGTPEHNQELGERRAVAVARALGRLGVSNEQLRVVSYGENRALCGESDAACWAKNRQATLVPTPAEQGR